MTTAQIIGLVVVLVLAFVAGFFIIKKSKKHDLAKWVGLFIFVAIAFTWIFSYGYFNGAEFVDYGMNRQGISDIPNLIYYSINLAGDKVIYLLALGAFYAVLQRSESYKKLVTNIASKFKGKEILFALISSFVFTLMTSMLSQTFIVLAFVPFVITILLNMKLDKLTAFSVTFGSILIGTLGVMYGGEGAYWFNYYTNLTSSTAILYRLIILVVSFILFNFFTVLHSKKVLAEKNLNEIDVDPFKVENVDKKAKVWPIVALFSLLFILIVLGYINWNSVFGITIFDDFHNWLIGLKLGDVEIFKGLLGTLSDEASKGAFGYWTLFHASILLIIFSALVSLVSKIKLNDFIDAYIEGAKKMVKPLALFVGIYMIMMAAYMSPFMPTITNTIFKSVSKFNPYLVSLDAFISNIFHVDFGFTGYSVGQFFVSSYGKNIEVIHTIFTTMYGFASICLPTSALLLIGLSYLDIDYKTWIKYIWIFVLALLVILIVLFTVMTYI